MTDTQTPADEPAHDVLAAEAFVVPVADPSLHPGPVVLPEDPSGDSEPHDILAAEEFAMPAAAPHPLGLLVRRSEEPWKRAIPVIGALLALFVLRRIHRRS
jgi:hypothetical protein